MGTTILVTVKKLGVILAGLLCASCDSYAQARADEPQIQASEVDRQIRDFLQKEATAHFADIKTLDPPPARVVRALTTGHFSSHPSIRPLHPYSSLPDPTPL